MPYNGWGICGEHFTHLPESSRSALHFHNSNSWFRFLASCPELVRQPKRHFAAALASRSTTLLPLKAELAKASPQHDLVIHSDKRRTLFRVPNELVTLLYLGFSVGKIILCRGSQPYQ
jgi:hypothetical protein